MCSLQHAGVEGAGKPKGKGKHGTEQRGQRWLEGKGWLGQGRDHAMQHGAGVAQPTCSAAQCRVSAVWCRCRATKPWAGGQPPGMLALTAQEGLDMADQLPQLLVGALHTGPGLVRLVQGCLRSQPGLVCLPLGLCHLNTGRDPWCQPQGLQRVAVPPDPTSTYVPHTL